MQSLNRFVFVSFLPTLRLSIKALLSFFHSGLNCEARRKVSIFEQEDGTMVKV